jgi:hypothetical protein
MISASTRVSKPNSPAPSNRSYGFRMIPVQSGQHRLSVHLPESVLSPTRSAAQLCKSARIESQHSGIQSESVSVPLPSPFSRANFRPDTPATSCGSPTSRPAPKCLRLSLPNKCSSFQARSVMLCLGSVGLELLYSICHNDDRAKRVNFTEQDGLEELRSREWSHRKSLFSVA